MITNYIGIQLKINTMKKSTLLSMCNILLLFLGPMSSCKKEDMKGKPVLDKEAFFTINFNSRVYTAYGYYDNASAIPYDGPSILQATGIDASGNLVPSVTLYCMDVYTWSLSSNPLSLGNCHLALSMDKDNMDLLGLYTSITATSAPWMNAGTDEEIFFNPTGCRLTLDRIVEHSNTKAEMIEGTLSCRVYTNNSGLITYPAYGSFRMYLK